MATLMHDTMWRLTFLPMLTVSLIRGRALGGGAEISTASDFRVFSPSGSLEFIQAKIGLTSNYSGSRLVRLIGQREALKLLLSCRKVDSKEAKKLGLCDLITYGEGYRATSETILWLQENFLEDPGAQNATCIKIPHFSQTLRFCNLLSSPTSLFHSI